MSAEVLLEVCVDRLEDAIAAEQAGANRLELCGALELGGLTPSIGLVEEVVAATSIEVVVMIRPRAGGFGFDDQELRWRGAMPSACWPQKLPVWCSVRCTRMVK